MSIAEQFKTAVTEFDRRVSQIKPDQWQAATPDTDWDVRALINHVTGEYLWVPELLAGKTIAEVGSKFDGDVLGQDPAATWKQASAAAVKAAADPAALEGIVHLSFGDVPGAKYIEQMFIDSIIHSWDLAKALGGDDTMPAELAKACLEVLQPQAEEWRSGGAFGPVVEVPVTADLQTKLLALTGRQRG